jgi:hypothetical protein
MNARQRKKQFKKRYGHNPSKSIKREEIINAFELLGRTIEKNSAVGKEYPFLLNH